MLLCSSLAFSQHGKVARTLADRLKLSTPVTFKPLVTNENPGDVRYRSAVDGATIATLDASVLSGIFTSRRDVIRLQVPYQQATISVLLYKVKVTTDDFGIETDKGKIAPPEAGVFYRGTIEGQPESLAAFSFFRNGMTGTVSSASLHNLNIAKLVIPGNVSDYVIYSDAKMKVANDFQCHFDDKVLEKAAISEARGTVPDRCVTFYFEMDFDLYLQNNSSTEDTTNWMLSVFNNVQTLYDNDDIDTAIKSIFIWTEDDPYVGFSSFEYLYQFNAVRPSFNGDLGQLVAIDQPGLGGVAATIDGLCSPQNFSYSDLFFEYETVPTFSWTIMVITHEFGHLMGSPHTHSCFWNGDFTPIDVCGPTANPNFSEGCTEGPLPTPEVGGTIMSYCHLLDIGVNLANGFGPQPANQIKQTINSSNCLSTDCVNTCISLVHDIVTTNVTNASITIAWSDDNANTSWEAGIALYPFDVISWTTVSEQTATFSGLPANTYYKVFVRSLCGDLISTEENAIFATTTDWCNGVLFLDTGGAGGSYTDAENWIRIVKPLQEGAKAKVTFANIDIEAGFDFLFIHNGEGTTAELLTPDGITGNELVGPFESTDASGALTFHFISDFYTVGEGWSGQITCTNLGIESADVLDFSYTPNPTGGIVRLHSSKAFSGISVYGIDGKLLLDKKVSATDSTVDLSGYASGIYLFKVDVDGKLQTFRIIRQ